jgi:hypothetical protein
MAYFNGKKVISIFGGMQKPEEYGIVNMTNVTYDPTTKLYVKEPTAGKVFKDIELQKDIYLIPSNIKKGVKIEGVTGTYEGTSSTISTSVVTINPTGEDCRGYYTGVSANNSVFTDYVDLRAGDDSVNIDVVTNSIITFTGMVPTTIAGSYELVAGGGSSDYYVIYQIKGNVAFYFE